MNKVYVLPLEHPHILAMWFDSRALKGYKHVKCPCTAGGTLKDFLERVADEVGSPVEVYTCCITDTQKIE